MSTGSAFPHSSSLDPPTNFAYLNEQYLQSYNTTNNLFTIISSLDSIALTTGGATAGEVEVIFGAAQQMLLVQADTVNLSGTLSLPGQIVMISARVVQLDGDVTIDVSGAPGTAPAPASIFTSSAAQGTEGNENYDNGGPGNTGAAGASAATGASGGTGGDITIWASTLVSTNGPCTLTFQANGGAGGTGQQGQAGQQGGTGGIGIGSSIGPMGGGNAGSLGGSGGTGGVGGNGGYGGTGGAAGVVGIGILNPSSTVTVQFNLIGGQGGLGGDGGDGGYGGDAGSNGRGTNGTGGNGGTGGTGGNGGGGGAGGPGPTWAGYAGCQPVVTYSGGAPGISGTGGVGGSAGNTISGYAGGVGVSGGTEAGFGGGSQGRGGSVYPDFGVSYLAWYSSPGEVLMLLQKAKLLYEIGDPSNSPAPLLDWLNQITAPFVTSTPPDNLFSPADIATFVAINQESGALTQQYLQRRDFYGNLPSYAPRPAYTFYQTLLQPQLGASGYLATVETAYINYYTALSNQTLTTAQLNSALTVVQNQLGSGQSSLQSQISAAVASANLLTTTIAADQNVVARQSTTLAAALASYEAQLAAIAGAQCFLSNVIEGTTMLAKFGGADADTVTSIGSAASSGIGWIFQQLPNLTQLPDLSLFSQLDTLNGSDPSTLQANVTQSWSTYSAGVTTNAYKLLASQAQIDALIQPYVGVVSGAQAAVDAINQYVAAVTTLNDDLVQYNGLIAQIASLQQQVQQDTVQQGQLQHAIASGNSASAQLPALVAFMGRLYQDARSGVLATLYDAYRAYIYWSLDTTYQGFADFFGMNTPSGVTAATLTANWGNFAGTFQRFVQGAANGPSVFPANGSEQGITGLTYTLTAQAYPGLFSAFKTLDANQQHSMLIRIPPWVHGPEGSNAPAVFYDKVNVRATKVRPWIDGAAISGGGSDPLLQVSIVHTGGEWIVSPDAVTKNWFTHEPIVASFEYYLNSLTVETDSDFAAPDAQNNQYAAPSPFTTWRIVVDPGANPGLDMTNVNSLTLEFWGNFYPFQVNAA